MKRTTAGKWGLLGALLLSTLFVQAQEERGFSFSANGKASLSEVGIPGYPGAREYKESSSDSSSGSLGFMAGATDFKLVIMKFETADSQEKVAAFYRNALAKYGKVLDCSNGDRTTQEKPAKEGKELSCDDDHAEPGAFLFKAGTKPDQHLVGIKKAGDRTQFQLIYLRSKEARHYD